MTIGTTSQAIPLTKVEPNDTPSDPSQPGAPILFNKKLLKRAKKAIEYLKKRRGKK